MIETRKFKSPLKKLVGLALVSCLIFSLCLSIIILLNHRGHQHEAYDSKCYICDHIEYAKNILKEFYYISLAYGPIISIYIFYRWKLKLMDLKIKKLSLISLKVRLDQ